VLLIAGLAFTGFLIGSALKDYKDIPQDRAAGVETIYTLLLARGRKLSAVHHGVSSLLTIVLLIPVVVVGMLTRFDPLLAPLIVVAAVPQVMLIALDNRLHAVESALWVINAYLALLAVAITVLGPVM
jgi:4-hydroxybenzoate polyprenyltransferase